MAVRVASVAMAVRLAVMPPVRVAAAMDTMAAKEATVLMEESGVVGAVAPAAMRDRPRRLRWSAARKSTELALFITRAVRAVSAAAELVARASSAPRGLVGIQACSAAWLKP